MKRRMKKKRTPHCVRQRRTCDSRKVLLFSNVWPEKKKEDIKYKSCTPALVHKNRHRFKGTKVKNKFFDHLTKGNEGRFKILQKKNSVEYIKHKVVEILASRESLKRSKVKYNPAHLGCHEE